MSDLNAEIAAAKEGRTEEQQKVIDYFMSPEGCLSKNILDEEYDHGEGICFIQKDLASHWKRVLHVSW